MEVLMWLFACNLDQYAPLFEARSIDGSGLSRLSDGDLLVGVVERPFFTDELVLLLPHALQSLH